MRVAMGRTSVMAQHDRRHMISQEKRNIVFLESVNQGMSEQSGDY